jgi:predicted dehydrogenase
MNGKKLRFGILSTANIARKALIPAIRTASNAELIAISSRSQDKANTAAAEFKIPRAYGSYVQLLNDPDIDAVYIPLPNSMHCEWTIKAAEAGKHILCDKPLALNAAECDDMVAAAAANNVRFMEGFMYRFHPQSQRMKALIDEGAIGEVRVIHAGFTFPLTNPENIRLIKELGGGSLMDVGCYCVNVARFITEEEPAEVFATARFREDGLDVSMAGHLRFPSGVTAVFDSGFDVTRRQFYQVAGSEGCIDVSLAFVPADSDTTLVVHRSTSNAEVITIPADDQYRLMVEHFADCVMEERKFRWPATDGRNNMRVVDALYVSAWSGQPVSL